MGEKKMKFVKAKVLRDLIEFANNNEISRENIVHICLLESEAEWTMIYYD